jgi:hypothetical protein
MAAWAPALVKAMAAVPAINTKRIFMLPLIAAEE